MFNVHSFSPSPMVCWKYSNFNPWLSSPPSLLGARIKFTENFTIKLSQVSPLSQTEFPLINVLFSPTSLLFSLSYLNLIFRLDAPHSFSEFKCIAVEGDGPGPALYIHLFSKYFLFEVLKFPKSTLKKYL